MLSWWNGYHICLRNKDLGFKSWREHQPKSLYCKECELAWGYRTTQSKNSKKSVISGFYAVILWAMLQSPSQIYLANAKKIFDFLILTISTFFISLEPALEPLTAKFFSEGVRFLIANFNDFFLKNQAKTVFVTNLWRIGCKFVQRLTRKIGVFDKKFMKKYSKTFYIVI